MKTELSEHLTSRGIARLAKQVEVALAEVDISAAQYRLLVFLTAGSAAASALADTLAVSRPTITAVVDGLVARGLVSRNHVEHDRRRVIHELTAEGERTLLAADDAIHRRLLLVADFLTPAQARRAFEGLLLWHRALETALHKELQSG